MTKLARSLGVVALVAGAAAVTRRLLARREVFERRVASDLRSPMLYVIPSLKSDRALGVIRGLTDLAPAALPAGAAEQRTPSGVRVLLYEPTHRVRPSGALVWIHGGGMVMGRPEQGHVECARLAEEAGVVVVSVDYRLAPEHPFPAGLDDCCSVLEWVHGEAESLGVDPERIAVGGDSAGGGLAAAACQRAADAGGPRIALQLLVYPMLDDRTVLRDDLDPDGVYTWSPASNRYGWTAYLGHAPRIDDAPSGAAPARRTDLSGLPPAWIGVGDLDLFYDEDVDYAERLEAAGVPCELHVARGMWHGAPSMMPNAPTPAAMWDSGAAALTRAVGP